MAGRSFTKSSAATTSARAAQGAGFKNCCLRSGRFDGSPRNYFFPGVVQHCGMSIANGVLSFLSQTLLQTSSRPASQAWSCALAGSKTRLKIALGPKPNGMKVGSTPTPNGRGRRDPRARSSKAALREATSASPAVGERPPAPGQTFGNHEWTRMNTNPEKRREIAPESREPTRKEFPCPRLAACFASLRFVSIRGSKQKGETHEARN